MIKNLNLITINDSPEPWGLFFQDNVIPQMEELEVLYNNIMFYSTIILFAVSWIMISIIINYRKANKWFNCSKILGLIFSFIIALIVTLVFLKTEPESLIDVLDNETIIETTVKESQSLVEMLDNGIIPRLPLPSMPIMYMEHGLYDITGGRVIIDALIEDKPTHIYGLIPDGVDMLFAQKFNTIPLTNQPFDINLGCILYEIREAGIQDVTLDITGLPQMYNYIKACKLSIGEPISSDGSITITDSLINALGDAV